MSVLADMVQPTVLKRRHSLKGSNLLPLVKKIRDAPVPKQTARMVATQSLESMANEVSINSGNV